MTIFKNEADLLTEIDRHDEMARQCAHGEISFDEFCKLYRCFYSHYALDGHESDNEEIALLKKHDARILPHRLIYEDVFENLCSTEDAEKETYKKAGRFGPSEAILKLKRIVDLHLV